MAWERKGTKSMEHIVSISCCQREVGRQVRSFLCIYISLREHLRLISPTRSHFSALRSKDFSQIVNTFICSNIGTNDRAWKDERMKGRKEPLGFATCLTPWLEWGFLVGIGGKAIKLIKRQDPSRLGTVGQLSPLLRSLGIHPFHKPDHEGPRFLTKPSDPLSTGNSWLSNRHHRDSEMNPRDDKMTIPQIRARTALIGEKTCCDQLSRRQLPNFVGVIPINIGGKSSQPPSSVRTSLSPDGERFWANWPDLMAATNPSKI